MIKIVSFKICPFVQRVTAALEAKKVPYSIEYISLDDKPQWFLDLSPNGQVPILVTESGKTLFESDAIIEYIDDEFGALELNVSNEDRALERAWSYLGTKHYMTQCGTMSSKDKVSFEERVIKLEQVFKKVEKQLSGATAFFKSDSLSKVDIAWLPLLHRFAIVKEYTGYDFLCGLPKVQAWQKAILSTGLIEKTVSEDFNSRFHAFYLTNTYLSGSKGDSINRQSASCC